MPRLRQVALVARHLEPIASELQSALSLPEPFRDPGISAFGLQNVVFAVGDTFLEVVSPVRDGTTAGRYLDKRGGDGGYMAIFQCDDLAAARARVEALGIRVVWSADHPDIAGTHLHPKDVPGAIVSLDWARPPESWRWAGPEWTGGAPAHDPGGIIGVTVEVTDPEAVTARWAAVLGANGRDTEIDLPGQRLRFAAPSRTGEGISVVTVARGDDPARSIEVGGIHLQVVPVEEEQP